MASLVLRPSSYRRCVTVAGAAVRATLLDAVLGRRAVSRSCDGERSRPQRPCAPPQRPVCRPRPPAVTPRGLRVVCCAPSQGARPPCTPPALAPSLTCANCTGADREARFMPAADRRPTGPVRCGAGQDRVARRLAAAAAERRADYEREAAERRPASPAPLAPYTLGEDRVCTRATDGREYALPCAPRPLARCGSDGAPPSPRCVPLRPDDACRFSGDRLDPCAHRPRVFVEIDRAVPSRTAGAPNAAAQGSSSRVVNAPGRSRRTPCPSVEDISRRRMHSFAKNFSGRCDDVSGSLNSESDQLHVALREREVLEEAGRGRVAAGCARGPRGTPAVAGRLDVAVPRGVERVTVCVALSPAPEYAAPTTLPYPLSAPTAAGAGESGPQYGPAGSWLCIKTIQRRFAACRRPGTTGAAREVSQRIPSPPCSSPRKHPAPRSLPPRLPSGSEKTPPSPCVPPRRPPPAPPSPSSLPANPSPSSSPAPPSL